MPKRYTERHTRESPLWPLDLGLGPKYDHVVVHDNETGNTGEGWGTTEREARGKAYKDLRERQGV